MISRLCSELIFIALTNIQILLYFSYINFNIFKENIYKVKKRKNRDSYHLLIIISSDALSILKKRYTQDTNDSIMDTSMNTVRHCVTQCIFQQTHYNTVIISV